MDATNKRRLGRALLGAGYVMIGTSAVLFFLPDDSPSVVIWARWILFFGWAVPLLIGGLMLNKLNQQSQ
jgi:hypothetical protein